MLTFVKIKIWCTQELWNSTFIPHCIWTYMQVQIREIKIIVERLNIQLSQPPIFTEIYLMSRNTNISIKFVWNINFKKLNGVGIVGSFRVCCLFSLDLAKFIKFIIEIFATSQQTSLWKGFIKPMLIIAMGAFLQKKQ